MHKAALVFQNAVPKAAKKDGIELYDRARQVRETTESPGWAYMARLLGEQREYLLTCIYPTEGLMPSQAEYAAVHGQIAGIDMALHLAEAVIELAERADDERSRQLVAAGEEQR